MKKLIAALFLSVIFTTVFAQHKQKGIATRITVVKGDTFPYVGLSEVKIVSKMSFKSRRAAENFGRLKVDVKKAYPYAILAAARLKECNAKMATMHLEAEKKLYMKRVEKEVVKQFEGDMKQLTLTQGKILIKLIDRETKATSYNLVKELRGSFSAWMWQSLAMVFGANLKAEYDPINNDKDRKIEQVIHLIESGEI